MQNKFVLSPLSASHELTVWTLKKADRAFYRMRRAKEAEYQLTHGTFNEA